MNAQLACQAIALLLGIAWNILRMVLELPYWLLKNALLALRGGAPGAERRRSRAKGRCWFYEGMVTHARRAPATNKFAYPVRMAVVDLDDPPAWWAAQAHDHLTANAARRFAGARPLAAYLAAILMRCASSTAECTLIACSLLG